MARIIGKPLFKSNLDLLEFKLGSHTVQRGSSGLMYFFIAFRNGLILLRELVGNQKSDN